MTTNASKVVNKAPQGLRRRWWEVLNFKKRPNTNTNTNTTLTPRWEEVRLSDCLYGCKVFGRTVNGQLETMVIHNPLYGCNK